MNTETTPTIDEITSLVKAGQIKEHHTAAKRGYISRTSAGKVEKYSGKFGEGYTISRPRFDTSSYIYVTYYVK